MILLINLNSITFQLKSHLTVQLQIFVTLDLVEETNLEYIVHIVWNLSSPLKGKSMNS